MRPDHKITDHKLILLPIHDGPMSISCSEPALARLAEALACVLRRGDVIALYGELGVGKTTFARYLIRALAGHDEEVPSPTFSLLQTYESPRAVIYHFDLYRLEDPQETLEIGFDDACEQALVLVEWPERAGDFLPDSRLELHLTESDDPLLRNAELIGLYDWQSRLLRFEARQNFLARSGYGEAQQSYLQGDASTRAYARICTGDETKAGDGRTEARRHLILMDQPAMAASPPLPTSQSVPGGLPYSRIAHLAEDIRPFVAVALALHQAGFSAPEIHDHDLAQGFLLLEDLGEQVFGREIERGRPQELLWQAAVDALVALRRLPAPEILPLPDGSHHVLPRFDCAAMRVEVSLLIDWLWPVLHGAPVANDIRDEFFDLWMPIFARLQEDANHWLLRDYHSPNLLWLPQRRPPANVGIIDFQDALRGPAAYDLVSLLQDARLDVAVDLERQLLDYYCGQAAAQGPGGGFDRSKFAFEYAAMGAQRNSKILGIFARLALRDGKPQYLTHLPRIWGYLASNLRHRELAALGSWYDRHFPQELRERLINMS